LPQLFLDDQQVRKRARVIFFSAASLDRFSVANPNPKKKRVKLTDHRKKEELMQSFATTFEHRAKAFKDRAHKTLEVKPTSQRNKVRKGEMLKINSLSSYTLKPHSSVVTHSAASV
jgi:hypothetical protein